MILSDCPFLNLIELVVVGSTVTHGDGGAIWTSDSSDSSSFMIINSHFNDSTAPAGAGGVLFSLADGVREPSRVDTWHFYNTISMTDAASPVALFGPVQASSVVRLRPLNLSLTIHPGQTLDPENSSTVQLSVFAVDAYNQTMTSESALVVQVDVTADANASAAAASTDVVMSGSPLQRVSATDGAATFRQLRIAAMPGVYTLSFTLVSQPDIATTVTLHVRADCPLGLHFDREQKSCVTCQSDIHVYNATAERCMVCPAGQQLNRAAAACQLCPLGSISAAGADCASCGLNAYQPLGGAACQPCTGVAGLQCTDSGLAAVMPGFFAFSVWDEAAGGPRIRTHLYPDGFCSGGFVQQDDSASRDGVL